jgi:FkbM family methyltransferase
MNLVGSIRNRLHAACCRWRCVDQYAQARITALPDLKRIGGGCGWVVPLSCLPVGTVCYCVGAGEDISFDLALARDVNCEVHTFDPTPRAIAHVASLEALLPPRLSFHPWGVWERDERVRFYAPRNPEHVSHSILNLQKTTEYFEADCKRLQTIMGELGHRSLGLLKLDIEGAEYAVIGSMLADGIRPRVLAVEFDEIGNPLNGGARSRIKAAVGRLVGIGYRLVAVEGPNYTFVSSPGGCC